jgi:beta-lactam-binding protein with PASTA domain
VATPKLIGLSTQQAVSAVKLAESQVPPGYFAYTPRQACNGNVDPTRFGTVYAQSPAPGSPLTFGQPVTTDAYQPCTTVPSLVKLSEAQARSAIAAANLTVGQVATGTCLPGVPSGIVTSQDQPAGAIVPTGTPVSLVITPSGCG